MAEQGASTITTLTPTPSLKGADKSLKRKLEDALQCLDEAVGPTAYPTVPTHRPPLKKLRTSRSIYAMLAKYGVKKEQKQPPTGDLDTLSKTAPHLAAILSRTATRTKKALPFRLGQQGKPLPTTGSSTSDYRPSSMNSFLARLSTYKLTTYGNKPQAIDAVAASKCGWINDGKDRLVCGLCCMSWVLASKDGMAREAANTLVEKQRAQLVSAHKDGCPWKTRQCDDNIYRIPLQAPLPTIREIKSRAILLDSVMNGVEIKHPLTSAQIQSMSSIVSSVSVPSYPSYGGSQPSTPSDVDESPLIQESPQVCAEPSEVSVLTAMFGWSILPPVPPGQVQGLSVSRATSIMPATPARSIVASRASSVARESTPSPTITRPPLRISSSGSLLSQHSVSNGSPRADTTLLHCSLCQRRIGLWAFLPKPQDTDDPMVAIDNPSECNKKPQSQRQLDILREHRPYCPYVVRSSVLPSFSSPTSPQERGHQRSASHASLGSVNSSMVHINAQPGAIEGWRAIMAVVLRYGNVQRQRLGLNRTPSTRVADGISAVSETVEGETDTIEAMVAGVKSHGGRDLLKYVKGLLG